METYPDLRPVLCVGDLVADIFASSVSKMPLPGEGVMTDEISVFPGGNALNIALAINNLGDSVKLCGDLGNDSLGNLLLTDLKKNGLDTSGIRKVEGGVTPSTFIFRVVNEDRRLISNLGVGAEFDGKNLSESILPSDGIVVIAGYLKLYNWDDNYLKHFLKLAKKKNNTVVLNISYIQNSNVDTQRCIDLLDSVDIFVLNEDEAKLITGEQSNKKQSERFRETGLPNIIITKGSDGLYAENSDLSVNMKTVDVTLVDPTGCGDCFVSGLITSLRRNSDFLTMLKYGTALGAISANSLGCTTGIPSYEEIEKFIQKHDISYTIE